MMSFTQLKKLLAGYTRPATAAPPPESTLVNQPAPLVVPAPDSIDYYFYNLNRKIERGEPFTTQDYAQAQLIMACMGRKAEEEERKKTKITASGGSRASKAK